MAVADRAALKVSALLVAQVDSAAPVVVPAVSRAKAGRAAQAASVLRPHLSQPSKWDWFAPGSIKERNSKPVAFDNRKRLDQMR